MWRKVKRLTTLGPNWCAACWNTSKMKLAAARLNQLPQLGRDFLRAEITIEQALQPRFPDVSISELQEAWQAILKRAKLVQRHKITREELSGT